jgi:hypothetical protein
MSRTPTVVAITTCTAKAAVAPSRRAKGWPRVAMTRVAMTREANMVLSGSSPRKITGKTATKADAGISITNRGLLPARSSDSAAGADD